MSRLFYSSTVLLIPQKHAAPGGVCRTALKQEPIREEPVCAHGYLFPPPLMARAAGESFIGSVKRRMPSYL